MAESVTILTVPARSRYFNSRRNVAEGPEVLEQHRECRVMECPHLPRANIFKLVDHVCNGSKATF
jgi:hypothetical protein